MENDKLFEAFNISELITKQINGELTLIERHHLESWINKEKGNQQVFQSLKNEIERKQSIDQFSDKRSDEAYARVVQRIGKAKQKPLHQKYRYIGIAAAFVIVSAITLAILKFQKNAISVHQNVAVADVLPGSNKAVLTLANGNKISLSDAKNGELAEQSGIKISKTANGMIVYSTATNSKANTIYNTVETPKGGEFKVVLPDGSKVWLNAASVIKYPLSFSALKERQVELIGEAYFEIAHNKAQPFRVKTANQTVEVLGTHFNVNSYADEKKTTTTLEEGSVKVYTNSQTKIIKPGEQVLLNQKGNLVSQEADLQTALAWKNGKIQFKDADIKTIMRQVSRWYNIEVEYQGEMPERAFNGGVARKSNLSSLLKILELNNIHFSIETNGSTKKLIVKP